MTLPPVPDESPAAYIGVDVGSATIKVAGISGAGALMGRAVYLRHDAFLTPLDALKTAFARYLSSLDSSDGRAGVEVAVGGVGITGSGRELYKRVIGADLSQTEIIAHAAGVRHLLEILPEGARARGASSAEETDEKEESGADPVGAGAGLVGTVIELGGQDSKVIIFDENGVPSFFNMNTICSAGTGEFLKQLADEAGLDLDELGRLAMQSTQPAVIDATCTVFAKRDFRHLTQKGVPLADRLMGVCLALARNYLTNVVQHTPLREPIYFQGGVAFNPAMRKALAELLRRPVRVTPHHELAGAVGMAALVRELARGEDRFHSSFREDFQDRQFHSRLRYCHGCVNACEVIQPWEEYQGDRVLWEVLGGRCDGCRREENLKDSPPVPAVPQPSPPEPQDPGLDGASGWAGASGRVGALRLPIVLSRRSHRSPGPDLLAGPVVRRAEGHYFAGLDGGSRGTKYVLLTSTGSHEPLILTAGSIDTAGDAIAACLAALRKIREALPAGASLSGIGTTGSASELFRDMITLPAPHSADPRCTEIIAHYIWARYRRPEVGTVIDIGGNDAKLITIAGDNLDFAMNDKCAAGTGSFLEAIARRFHLPISAYGDKALEAQHPARIAGRCAVFGESDLVHKARSGFAVPELLLGAAYAICRTYLSDTAKGKTLLLPIVAQGGAFLNRAVQQAFRTMLQLDENDFYVDGEENYVLCAGALGAALLARARWQAGAESRFKGFTRILNTNWETRSVTCSHQACGRTCRGLISLLADGVSVAGYKAIDCPLGRFSGRPAAVELQA